MKVNNRLFLKHKLCANLKHMFMYKMYVHACMHVCVCVRARTWLSVCVYVRAYMSAGPEEPLGLVGPRP